MPCRVGVFDEEVRGGGILVGRALMLCQYFFNPPHSAHKDVWDISSLHPVHESSHTSNEFVQLVDQEALVLRIRHVVSTGRDELVDAILLEGCSLA